jgi:hypothetical protein
MLSRCFHIPRWLGHWALAFSALTNLSSPAWAQKSPFTPYQHRALYIFNIAKYTEWPQEALPDAASFFVLGILGPDPFGKDIEIIKGKPLKNRALVVKYFNRVEEVAGCHALYISKELKPQARQALQALARSSVLTVAEMEGFIEQGGMVNFVSERKTPEYETVGFEINQAAAEQAGLKLDARLLQLAKRVKN